MSRLLLHIIQLLISTLQQYHAEPSEASFHIKKGRIPLILLLIISLSACEEKVDWELESGTENLLVVDGILTNEPIHQTVRLTRTANELNKAPQPVSDAAVTITSGDSNYTMSEMASKRGTYQTNQILQGVTGKEYTLTIELEGETYTATSRMVPVTPLEPLQYGYASDSLYQIAWVSDQYSDDPALYQIYLDWSDVPGYDTLDEQETRAKLIAYEFNTLDISQVFRPDKASILFPEGTVIVERKYSLTPEYAAFLRALMLETEWRSGLFDEAAANLPTNVSNGAVGFFAASTVVEDTIVVNP